MSNYYNYCKMKYIFHQTTNIWKKLFKGALSNITHFYKFVYNIIEVIKKTNPINKKKKTGKQS